MDVYDNSYIATEIHDSLWVPPPSFQGPSSSMVNFEVESSDNIPDHPFNSVDQAGVHPTAEKKRRLKASQVKYLEKSFEADNKLEPDRKIQLAKELGLHPRQVAIWFQNRRARYKTKYLEKEYDSLKTSYDSLKKDYDSLFAENQKLQNEIELLMHKMEVKLKKEEEMGASSSRSDVVDWDNQSGDSSWRQQSSDLEEEEEPKMELEWLMPNSSCGLLGYPIQDEVQGTWFWNY